MTSFGMGSRLVGIKAGGDELPANVVIACDGVNSILAQKAGLRGELSPHDVKQGVKEVIQLPRELLEQRFNLAGDEGIAWEFIGSCTRGLPGGGFIYTNKDSLSVGIVVQLNAIIEKEFTANDLLEDFKKHPAVARPTSRGYPGGILGTSDTRFWDRDDAQSPCQWTSCGW